MQTSQVPGKVHLLLKAVKILFEIASRYIKASIVNSDTLEMSIKSLFPESLLSEIKEIISLKNLTVSSGLFIILNFKGA